jgi:photosystem I subunit 6
LSCAAERRAAERRAPPPSLITNTHYTLHKKNQDLENTTGSWDMYGQDSDKRYPAMQAEFFNRAGDILSRREALRAFVALSGIGAVVAFGAKGSAVVGLPITKGPQTGGENGKGGSVSGRL